MIGPDARSIVRLRAATSSARSVSGSGAATDLMPCAASPVITRAQLDPSAHPPWAMTTDTSFSECSDISSLPYTLNLRRSTQRLHPVGDCFTDLIRRILLHEMNSFDRHFGLRREAPSMF